MLINHLAPIADTSTPGLTYKLFMHKKSTTNMMRRLIGIRNGLTVALLLLSSTPLNAKAQLGVQPGPEANLQLKQQQQRQQQVQGAGQRQQIQQRRRAARRAMMMNGQVPAQGTNAQFPQGNPNNVFYGAPGTSANGTFGNANANANPSSGSNYTSGSGGPDNSYTGTGNSNASSDQDKKLKHKDKDEANAKQNDKNSGDDEEEYKKGKVRGDAPCVSWLTFGIPTRAVLLCVHGLGLHSDSFQTFGESISKLGIATYAIDVRGFGSWMDAKGHKDLDFKDCIADVKSTLEWLHRAHPQRPIFLLGESMGGAIVLHSAAQYPQLMDGLISAAASADRFQQKKTDLGVAFHALLGPNREYDIGKKIVDQAAGDNKKLEEEWTEDPLNRMKLSPMDLLVFQKFMNENLEEAKKIDSMPVLIVQGSKDGLVKPEGTQEIFDSLRTKDKQMAYVANGEHLIFEEGQCTQADIQGVAKWIFAHCPEIPEATVSFNDLLGNAKRLIEDGATDQAIAMLQNAVQISPENPQAHYLLGLAQYHKKHFRKAVPNFILARRFGPGTEAAMNANKMMMMLPPNMVAPRNARRNPRQKLTMGKPKVLVFNAGWCQPCKDMDSIIDQAKQKFGQRVDFLTIDVDNPANTKLVDEYEIGPVPTTVFLKASGEIGSFQIGYSGIDGMASGLQSLLPTIPGQIETLPGPNFIRSAGQIPASPLGGRRP